MSSNHEVSYRTKEKFNIKKELIFFNWSFIYKHIHE